MIQTDQLVYQRDANPQVKYDKDEGELKCLRAMCDAEYAMREKKSNVYHMGLVTRQGVDVRILGRGLPCTFRVTNSLRTAF